MCLIVVREPNIELPFDRLETAVKNNPDGWGYVIPDRGQMEIRRFYSGEDTDPDKVAKFLEDNKEQKVYLHLRYATAGAKSKENVHPFPVLTKRKHGAQIMVMHNGTYSNYKPEAGGTDSDTKRFTEQVLTPILNRFAKNCSKKTLLIDPVVAQVLEKFNEGWSRLVLMDAYGNDLKLGEGTQQEGYWVSNDYSFNVNHRKPTVFTSPTGYMPPTQVKSYHPVRNITPSKSKAITTPTTYVSVKPTSAQAQPVVPDEHSLTTEGCQSFLDSYGLDSFKDFMQLTTDDYEELCYDHPELMARCVRDLLFLLYNQKKV